jgi:hypothetical protein
MKSERDAMRNPLRIGLAAISLLLGAQTCRASYLVSLSTTAPDLNNLAVGQKIALDVNLSGISRRITWTSSRRP